MHKSRVVSLKSVTGVSRTVASAPGHCRGESVGDYGGGDVNGQRYSRLQGASGLLLEGAQTDDARPVYVIRGEPKKVTPSSNRFRTDLYSVFGVIEKFGLSKVLRFIPRVALCLVSDTPPLGVPGGGSTYPRCRMSR